MIRISDPKQVHEILSAIVRMGGMVHLDESRQLVVMTPEMFQKCIDAAREGARLAQHEEKSQTVQ